jgi:hypothetical protein
LFRARLIYRIVTVSPIASIRVFETALPTLSVRDRAIIVLNHHRFWGYASGPSSSGNTLPSSIHAQSGRSLLTTDKNVARAYRFAIKAGIGSKRPTAALLTGLPRSDRQRSVSSQSARAQPVASDFARLILPARAASLFGNDCQAIENARGHFWHFFQIRLEIVE